jgi:DnaJ family protein A protein 2
MDHYKILGVPMNASQEDIKKAYRQKALLCHPDKGGDPEEFKKLLSSYKALTEEKKSDANLNQFFSDVINREFFKNFGFNFPSYSMKNTPTFFHTTSVTLEDLCQRKIRHLRVTRNVACECTKNPSPCGECKGTGFSFNYTAFGENAVKTKKYKCAFCEQGKVYKGCAACEKGVKKSEKVFELFFTPEMYDGYEYTFSGQGNQEPGKQPGNFIVKLKLKRSGDLECDRNGNLFTEKTITLKEALCGVKITIEHPSGKTIILERNCVTTDRDKIVSKGDGKTPDRDLYVNFKVKFPRNLEKEQVEKLLEIL